MKSSDLFNGKIKYYLKIYTFDLSLNLPYITIYITETKVLKDRYLMRRDNTIYTFSIKVSFSSKGQDKSKLQKQTRFKKNAI